MQEIKKLIEQAPGELDVKMSASMSHLGTFRLGGNCALLIDCKQASQVPLAINFCQAHELPFQFIGGGSNILFSDADYDAVLIRYLNPDLVIEELEDGLKVSAAGNLDQAAEWMAEQGWDGLMCLTGIPGTIGGAIAGNAGAWGEQVGDKIMHVELIDRQGNICTLKQSELGFVYRNSRIKEEGWLVLSATLKLHRSDPANLLEQREKILLQRAEKHPDLTTTPCIGSIFRNIEPSSSAERRQAAGYFLEQAGAKKLSVGGAKLFEKHANIIIAEPGARAQDVCELHKLMIAAVEEKFDFSLKREVRFLGSFEGEPAHEGFW